MPYVVAGGILAILFIVAIATGSALRLRHHDIVDAERNLRSLDLILREETERSMQSADLVLQSLQDRIAADGVHSRADLIATQAGEGTRQLLQSRLAGIPQISALFIVDNEGAIVSTSLANGERVRNIADRDHFEALREAPAATMFLSEPRRNRTDGRWTSYLARRINGPGDRFLGIVVCAIDLDYFERLYRSLDVGMGGAVSLWRLNGMLMVRHPPLPDKTGTVLPIRTFTGILRDDVPVTYESEKSIDGLNRLVATIKVRQFPLVINVTATFDEILADWRQTAAIIAVGTFFCIAAVLVVMGVLARQFRAYDALSIAQAERGEAEAARALAEDQLRQAQKLEALGQLTGGVAHDFNNLLTAVLGSLELLQRHTRDREPRSQRWVQNALDAAQRGAVLTQRLLAFSRRQPLNPTATDVAQLVRSLSDLLGRTLGENVRMETRLAADLWRADVDANQLDNAILNIAINARDAMDGRGLLTIEASNCRMSEAAAADRLDGVEGDFVLVAIADTGCGIPPDAIGHVFEPFFTTKPIGQGTGLGLSQVYGFVKQSGGHIAIRSTVGAGTRVTIYLPLAEPQAEVAPRPGDGRAAERLPEAMRVLVVEDDAAVRSYSLETLGDLGLATVAARDAAEALAVMAQGERFDLLLTDVGLPGLNGHELAVKAKAIQPDLRVLFVSGYTRDAIMAGGRLDRGVQLLSKPYTRADLQAKLAQVMGRQDQVRASA